MTAARLALPLLILLAACSKNEPAAAPDAGNPTTGPGAICVAAGAACDATTACCSGICGSDGLCGAAIFCQGPGQACAADGECCTLRCASGACAEQRCFASGQACANGSDCCSTICGSNGTCSPVPPGPGGDTCDTLGEACAAGAECCSTNCQGGICVRAFSCQANGDVCRANAECCGNLCSAAAGGVGRCLFESGAGAGGCIQGGNPCPNGGSNCCSRVCADLGAGVPVCQVASGCRLTGEWCDVDQSCCGGGSNPNGTVMCRDAPGRCDNGQSCNPVGNICGAPVLLSGGSINASQNCCDGKKEVCKLDSSGIPRCFGGCPNDDCTECPTGYDPNDPDCCIPSGSECQFRDQCCGGAPCVPNANGVLVCGEQPDCVLVGEVCIPGAPPGPTGCCGGSECFESSQSGVFVCRRPGPPDPGSGGGADAGPRDAGDAGTCAPNGAACTGGAQCCSAICTGGVCGAPAPCQGQGASCSASGDCCSGLDCAIPAGRTAGTCEPGAACSNHGQVCSGTIPCCAPLSCRGTDPQAPCDGTTSCVCIVDL